MFRVGIVLAVGAVVSVLALGGVETLAFAPAQVAVVILATMTFWRRGFPSISRMTLSVLCGLLRGARFRLWWNEYIRRAKSDRVRLPP